MTEVNKGKILYAEANGIMYMSRNQKIFKRTSEDNSWKKICVLPSKFVRKISAITRLSSRLFRNEIRAFVPFSDLEYCAINRDAVFYIGDSGKKIIRSRFHVKGPKVEPAINLEIGPNKEVLFGEYFNNSERRSVRILVSRDRGKNFEVAYTFPEGEVRHIHNIIWDRFEKHYWVLVGDHKEEPGVMALSEDFELIDWLAKGNQKFRAVHAFVEKDSLIYSMDTEMEDNFIVSLSKRSGKIQVLEAVDGSCLHKTRSKDFYVVSTCIEPLDDPDNSQQTRSSIWISKDTKKWQKIISFDKDRWDSRYFQFGTIVLPQGQLKDNILYFSGQALRRIDNQIYKIDLDDYWKAN